MNKHLEIVKHVKMEIEENEYRTIFLFKLTCFVFNWYIREIYYWNFQKQDARDYAIMILKMKRINKNEC